MRMLIVFCLATMALAASLHAKTVTKCVPVQGFVNPAVVAFPNAGERNMHCRKVHVRR